MEATLSSIYLKGFNNGYFLAKHNPPLIDKLIQNESNLEYIRALKDGNKTYQLEQLNKRIKEVKKLRSKDEKDIKR